MDAEEALLQIQRYEMFKLHLIIVLHMQRNELSNEYKSRLITFFCFSEKIQNDFAYLSWLARCCIMNGKARIAWELYLKMETSGESFSLLQLVANDCYKV